MSKKKRKNKGANGNETTYGKGNNHFLNAVSASFFLFTMCLNSMRNVTNYLQNAVCIAWERED